MTTPVHAATTDHLDLCRTSLLISWQILQLHLLTIRYLPLHELGGHLNSHTHTDLDHVAYLLKILQWFPTFLEKNNSPQNSSKCPISPSLLQILWCQLLLLCAPSSGSSPLLSPALLPGPRFCSEILSGLINSWVSSSLHLELSLNITSYKTLFQPLL